uniref:Phytochrome (Fragments) n=1 Tax=Oryza longistaminata TaxID=4528 RepID=Q7M250_ORYLO
KEEKEVKFEVKTHGSKRDDGPVILVVNACASRDLHDHVVGVYFVAQDMTVHKLVMDKFTRVEGDYKASSCLDLEMAEFVLQDVFVAAVSQVLITCQGKGIRVSCNLIKHQGKGVPADLLSQMYEDDNKEQSDEGMSLAVSRNLLRLMNGDVRHMREAGMSTFILSVELA